MTYTSRFGKKLHPLPFSIVTTLLCDQFHGFVKSNSDLDFIDEPFDEDLQKELELLKD